MGKAFSLPVASEERSFILHSMTGLWEQKYAGYDSQPGSYHGEMVKYGRNLCLPIDLRWTQWGFVHQKGQNKFRVWAFDKSSLIACIGRLRIFLQILLNLSIVSLGYMKKDTVNSYARRNQKNLLWLWLKNWRKRL